MSKLLLTTREESGVSILVLDGELDAHTAIQFENGLEKLVAEGKFNIVINCGGLNYISSARLGVFMAFIETVRKKGGDIKLSNIPLRPYRVMELSAFDSLFEIISDEKQAIEKFQGR
jgi:anti-sigma B factor antagonist